MQREGNIIGFDEVDKSYYHRLDGSISIEQAPALFKELTEAQMKALSDRDEAECLDVMDVSEHMRQHRVAEAHRRLNDLGRAKKHLGMLAPDEIAASMPLGELIGIPGIELALSN